MSASVAEILQQVKTYAPDADLNPIMRAYLLAARAHQGQVRKSGEPYLNHPIEVARILAELRMDVDTLATAMVHDVLEDNPVTKEELRRELGDVVAELVDGVTKIGKLRYRNSADLAAENFRKMMLATSQDLRVILVKLADRTHNMRTIQFHNAERQRAIAKETMDIFVPLAARLGLDRIKSELEDLCFAVLEPEAYRTVEQYLQRTLKDREAYVERVVWRLEGFLAGRGIRAQVKGRAKHRYSIYRKTLAKGADLAHLHDLLAFRLLVADRDACYAALGLVHECFQPTSDRFKDYIARPKPNGYRSLHTVVLGPEDRPIEIQIRTFDMHREAEDGVAAHWRYKQGRLALTSDEVAKIARTRELFEAARDTEDAGDFFATVKAEFYANEVFVSTPAGDVKRLAAGATVLDFAYLIHTDLGHQCTGARVNGRQAPIRQVLQSGDTVEIQRSASQTPSRDWLEIARTSSAQAKIRRFLRAREIDQASKLGQDLLEAELRRQGWSMARVRSDGRWNEVLAERSFTPEALFVEVGRGNLPPTRIAAELLPEGTVATAQPNALGALLNRFRPRTESPVLITGEDGMVVRFGHCCGPLPGEEIVGWITRGRGITIHKSGCKELGSLEPSLRVEVAWDQQSEARHSTRLEMVGEDRPGLLAAVTGLIDRCKLNLQQVEANSEGGRARIGMRLAVREVQELETLISNLRRIKGVEEVYRVSS